MSKQSPRASQRLPKVDMQADLITTDLIATDLVTIGDLVADLIVPIERLPIEANQHQLAEYIRLEPGGIGNTLIVAQRLGLQTKAIGSTGDDDFGKQALNKLAAEGIDTSLVVTLPDSTTTTALVIVDQQAQHVFVGQFGSGAPLTYNPKWTNEIANARALFTNGYSLAGHGSLDHPSLLQCLIHASAHKVPIFFDLGPAYTSAKRADVEQVLAQTTLFLATSEELCQWTGIADPMQAATDLLERYQINTVVLKFGAEGCRIVTSDPAQEAITCPGFSVTERDTAGAGDAFAAACIYSFLNGDSLQQMGELANAVGAATVSQVGTGTALPTKAEVDRLIENATKHRTG